MGLDVRPIKGETDSDIERSALRRRAVAATRLLYANRSAPQRRATRPPGAQHLPNLNAGREGGVSAARARRLEVLSRLLDQGSTSCRKKVR
jgi:hypothetical protein